MGSALKVTETRDGNGPDDRSDDHPALIARIAADRDRQAFVALFSHFGPRVKAMMIKGGADHALADDIAQDTMMTVWRKAALFAADRGSASTWIFTIARNARIDRLRRQVSQPYEDIDDIELASDTPTAEDEVLAGQRAGRVTDALAGLPDEQRQIIELSFVHGISQSDIAARLSLPLGTVKSRTRLAYAKLRTELRDVT